jgi:hypothetical protein
VSRSYQLDKALRRAQTRDRKRTPRMHIGGKSVFGLAKLLRKKK